jgi:hypothetical protein
MGTNSVNNIALNAASVRLRFHLSAFGGVTKLTIPEETVKREKVPFIGDAYATAYTPGFVEIGDGELEMTTVAWKEMLASLPDQFSEVEFPITANESHVTLDTDYTVVMDRCSIIGTKRDIEAGEKAGRVTLKFQCMLVKHKGADGQYKTIARRAGDDPSTSPAAQALGF